MVFTDERTSIEAIIRTLVTVKDVSEEYVMVVPKMIKPDHSNQIMVKLINVINDLVYHYIIALQYLPIVVVQTNSKLGITLANVAITITVA